ncbi:hypothetical protein BMS3Abin15_01010 [bacterium BMS3Abin15]|nr:hypothetical protein BMS3Abin15_01010 [bacterium BMS3Abin15]HDZ85520.1 hypothetical protein [Candidatus Moranbacteria bacterium]
MAGNLLIASLTPDKDSLMSLHAYFKKEMTTKEIIKKTPGRVGNTNRIQWLQERIDPEKKHNTRNCYQGS